MTDATLPAATSAGLRQLPMKAFTLLLGLLATGGVLYTLWIVVPFAFQLLTGQLTTARILSTDTADGIVTMPGLAYSGFLGGLFALAQALVVGGALVVTFRRPVAVRRIGLFALVAWSLLWAAAAFRAESLTSLDHPSPTFVIALMAPVMIGWLFVRWNAHPREDRA